MPLRRRQDKDLAMIGGREKRLSADLGPSRSAPWGIATGLAFIRHAVWLYVRFTLSYRDVEDLLAERGLDVSYETVR